MFKKQNIAIIGTGWYGCHIASFLLQKDINIKIFDKSDSFFSAASGNNQNRLHQGFHYPRCSKTRFYSKKGFDLFKEQYSNLSERLDKNYYGIHYSNSLIDFQTYIAIMNSEKVPFEIIENDNFFNLQNIEGLLNCEEEYINPKKSKDHFSSYLSEYFEGNYEVNDSNLSNLKNKFDYVIDCSWGGIKNYLPETIFYEACLVLIYKSTLKEKVGLTIMDGKLFSIFPYIDNLYTISSVKETPISIHHSQLDAYKSCDNLIKDNSSLQDKINKFETEVLSVYPSFKEYFKFSYPQISVKTKFKSKLDSRLVESFRENNLISIYSGKIDTVFFAEDIINKEVFDE